MKSAFSSREKLKGAFKDYVSIAMYAGVDTAMASVDALIKSVEKVPKNLLTLARIAESVLYSDSSEIVSEQMYLPFARAVASSRKLPSEDRNYFARQVKIIESSKDGSILPDFSYRTAAGKKGMFNDIKDRRVILFIYEPENDDCRRTLVRLSADYNLKQLHEKEYLQFMVIYPGKPNDKWLDSVKDFPESWVVGASEEVAEMFDIKNLPIGVYLSSDHKILTKALDTDRLVEMFRLLNLNIK